MADIFLERDFDAPLTVDEVRGMALDSFGCMGIYDVDWQQSLLAQAGDRLFCHFVAPDTEAVRNVMRFNDSPYRAAWAGEIHDTGNTGPVNVVVERSWDEPVDFATIAAREKAGAWCLQAHDVTFLRSFFSADQRRMICLYRAPDAESVRQAQIKAGMPFEAVWSFQHLTPALLFPET